MSPRGKRDEGSPPRTLHVPVALSSGARQVVPESQAPHGAAQGVECVQGTAPTASLDYPSGYVRDSVGLGESAPRGLPEVAACPLGESAPRGPPSDAACPQEDSAPRGLPSDAAGLPVRVEVSALRGLPSVAATLPIRPHGGPRTADQSAATADLGRGPVRTAPADRGPVRRYRGPPGGPPGPHPRRTADYPSSTLHAGDLASAGLSSLVVDPGVNHQGVRQSRTDQSTGLSDGRLPPSAGLPVREVSLSSLQSPAAAFIPSRPKPLAWPSDEGMDRDDQDYPTPAQRERSPASPALSLSTHLSDDDEFIAIDIEEGQTPTPPSMKPRGAVRGEGDLPSSSPRGQAMVAGADSSGGLPLDDATIQSIMAQLSEAQASALAAALRHESVPLCPPPAVARNLVPAPEDHHSRKQASAEGIAVKQSPVDAAAHGGGTPLVAQPLAGPQQGVSGDSPLTAPGKPWSLATSASYKAKSMADQGHLYASLRAQAVPRVPIVPKSARGRAPRRTPKEYHARRSVARVFPWKSLLHATLHWRGLVARSFPRELLLHA